MFSADGLRTFVYGTRVGNAGPPPFLKIRSSKAFITGTIAIAIFTDIFLYSVVVPVLPFALTTRAGVKEEDVQGWTSIFLSVYGAALAVGSPLFGWFADRSTSRRVPLLLGLLALGGSTAMLCAGSSLAVLIAGRLLQGLTASIVWTVGLALLSDTVPKEDIGQAMGYTAAATSIGSLSGPLLGGIVYAHSGYYSVFAMGFAIIGLDILLRLFMIEKSAAKQWLPVASSNGQEMVSGNSIMDEIQPASVPEDFARLEKAVNGASAVSKKHLPPLIALLLVPRLLVALFGCFVYSTFLGALDSVLPLYVKDVFGWDSTGAGLIFICLVVPHLASPLVGVFSDRYGSRLITTTGLLGSVPCWVLMRFVTYNSIGQKVLLCALLALMGAFLTLVMAPLMAEIDHAVALEEKKKPGSMGKKGAAAQGFGLFNFAFAIGTLIGPLWAGFTVESAGWVTLGWSMGILGGVCTFTTFIWTGGRIMLRDKHRDEGAAA
ncbi:related to vesicular amine transporter [Rhynchosporium agropyri]|uniref:Related to vesicular amine transporter n=1 Tax=Rhynchosporium agropyri TaxID=914238 RepID=A0A1E1JU79_9HELO|nr:related to vesicular amine transporter [Rhynchosporium agropyri]